MMLDLSVLSWIIWGSSMPHSGHFLRPSGASTVNIEASVLPGIPGAAPEAFTSEISALISSGVTSFTSDLNSGWIAFAILSSASSPSKTDSAFN